MIAFMIIVFDEHSDPYKKRGIEGASSHSGRRQFITTLAEKQVNVRVIQALARHRNLVARQH